MTVKRKSDGQRLRQWWAFPSPCRTAVLPTVPAYSCLSLPNNSNPSLLTPTLSSLLLSSLYLLDLLPPFFTPSPSLAHIPQYFFFLPFFFWLFRAAPSTHGSSQARGQIGAIAAGLHHSHSNARSEARLRSSWQPTATPDP